MTAAQTMSPLATSRDIEQRISSIDEVGYCIINDALAPDVLSQVQTRLRNQARAERDAGVEFSNPGHLDNQWVNMLINKGEVFAGLVTHELASQVVSHALGPEFLLSCCDAQIKHAGSGFMPLHTDQWWMPQPSSPDAKPVRPAGMIRGDGDALEPSPVERSIGGIAVVNIMWMVTDFTDDNGATLIVPSSHRSGLQPDSSVPHKIKTLRATGKAGTALIFDGRLWHAAGANETDRTRYAITCTFCGPQFRQLENYTRGLRPEVMERASPEFLRLLGFKAWSTYGHTGDPSLDCSVSGTQALGELGGDAT